MAREPVGAGWDGAPADRGSAPGVSLRERLSDSLRDAVSGVDVDTLQRARESPPAAPQPAAVRFHVRDDVTELEREMTRLRADLRAREQDHAAQALAGGPLAGTGLPRPDVALGGRPAAGERRPYTPAAPSSRTTWSPARAMAPLAAPGQSGTAVAGSPAAGEATDAMPPQHLQPLLSEVAALRAEIDSMRSAPRAASDPTTALLLASGVALLLVAVAIAVRLLV